MFRIFCFFLLVLFFSGCCDPLDVRCIMKQHGIQTGGSGCAHNNEANRDSAPVWDTGDTAWWCCEGDSGSVWDTGDFSDTGQDARESEDRAIFMRTTGSNGFTYPLDVITAWQDTYDYAGYGACGSAYYYANTCHNGTDIGAAHGDSVYAIGAGTVISVSGSQNSTCTSGWGYDYGSANTCNMAVAMQHYAADGSPFVVVYGHLVYSASVTAGAVYAPGDVIGTIAYDYDRSSSTSSWRRTSSPHLHLGVFPGTSAPAVWSGHYGWGKLTCAGVSQAASATFPSSCTNNGSSAPGTYIGGKSWVTPPGAPTLSSPANGANVTSPVALSWTNSSGTYRSHIMACTNSSLTAGCMNPDGAMTGEEPSAAFATSYSATLAKGTYYWAVREIAYTDSGGWGSYSSVRSFTVR